MDINNYLLFSRGDNQPHQQQELNEYYDRYFPKSPKSPQSPESPDQRDLIDMLEWIIKECPPVKKVREFINDEVEIINEVNPF